VTILAYHSIDDSWNDPLAVTVDAFRWQMGLIAKRSPLPLSEYVLRLRADALPARAIAVTFDDGYRDLLEIGEPICGELGIRPTVFLATAHMDSGTPLGWRPEVRRQNLPLDWDGARALLQAGWEIGSHTATHPDLTSLPDPELALELEGSRRSLREALGGDCDTISYPYGSHDQRVRQAAAAAGYEAGFSLPTGREDHDRELAIPRIGVFRGENALRFRAKLTGLPQALKLALRPHRQVEGSAEGTRT
jgi:peptidoglycan/xylan/chitin deacetylase (PgdA/CDA1 family)